jgi:hypothetical protein
VWERDSNVRCLDLRRGRQQIEASGTHVYVPVYVGSLHPLLTSCLCTAPSGGTPDQPQPPPTPEPQPPPPTPPPPSGNLFAIQLVKLGRDHPLDTIFSFAKLKWESIIKVDVREVSSIAWPAACLQTYARLSPQRKGLLHPPPSDAATRVGPSASLYVTAASHPLPPLLLPLPPPPRPRLSCCWLRLTRNRSPTSALSHTPTCLVGFTPEAGMRLLTTWVRE